MKTAPDVISIRALDLRFLGTSCIEDKSDEGTGLVDEPKRQIADLPSADGFHQSALKSIIIFREPSPNQLAVAANPTSYLRRHLKVVAATSKAFQGLVETVHKPRIKNLQQIEILRISPINYFGNYTSFSTFRQRPSPLERFPIVSIFDVFP
jgi:hypothetical protein